ncbi:MAG: hypothetical protein ABL870_12200, partial [Sediminibacterium sp.]
MKHLLPCLLFVCIPFLPLNAQVDWQSTNGPEGGTFWSIYHDSLYAFAADEYHFFRTNNGSDWEQFSFPNLWPIATAPTKMAAGQNFGYNIPPSLNPKFVVSYDHGSSWIEGTMPPISSNYFTTLAVCSHGIYVPDGQAGLIFKTQDDGLTWDTLIPPGQYSYELWAFEDQLYAEWGSKFWQLMANGIDWEVVSPVFDNGDYPNTMFASDSLLFFATDHHIWASSNSGAIWTEPPVPFYYSEGDFVRIGNRIYRAGGNTGILYTDDFGHLWHPLPIPNDFNTTDLAVANNTLLCGTYNHGILSLDVPNNQLISANNGLNSGHI